MIASVRGRTFFGRTRRVNDGGIRSSIGFKPRGKNDAGWDREPAVFNRVIAVWSLAKDKLPPESFYSTFELVG